MRLDLNRLSPDPAWPTQRQDLQAAVTILQRHAAQGEPLRLLEAWGEAADGERIWVRFPEWLQELAHHYWRHYGEWGQLVLQRVINERLPVEPLH
jgi:hypothetical protein